MTYQHLGTPDRFRREGNDDDTQPDGFWDIKGRKRVVVVTEVLYHEEN